MDDVRGPAATQDMAQPAKEASNGGGPSTEDITKVVQQALLGRVCVSFFFRSIRFFLGVTLVCLFFRLVSIFFVGFVLQTLLFFIDFFFRLFVI